MGIRAKDFAENLDEWCAKNEVKYKVEDVRWTQYFSNDGMAIHENYWKPRDQFGIPSSHGCVGLVAEDAKFFWDWASVGLTIYSHY